MKNNTFLSMTLSTRQEVEQIIELITLEYPNVKISAVFHPIEEQRLDNSLLLNEVAENGK